MRLAYLVSQYPAITHTFILWEIRTLRRMGYQIDVVSIRPPDRPLEKLSPDEREEAALTWTVLRAGVFGILTAHVATLLSRPGPYLRGLWSAATLARLDLRAAFLNLAYFAEAVVAGHHMHRREITHMHTHFSSTVAMFLGRVFPITFSVTVHGPDEFNNALGFYLEQKVAECKFIVATTQFARSQLMRASESQHWHKLEVLPQGVDPDLFTPRPHREQPERFQMLSVGRLARVKGQPILIDAVKRLVQSGCEQLRLRIVGGGPEQEALARLILDKGLSQYVILEGPCNQEKVREFYRETDLFVLASFAEGVPTVLMEAMATEIPCVATWISGVPELIRHNRDGWLIPPSDPAVLAEAIEHLMNDSNLRQRLGAAGRKRVDEQFHLFKNTRQLAEIYERRLKVS